MWGSLADHDDSSLRFGHVRLKSLRFPNTEIEVDPLEVDVNRMRHIFTSESVTEGHPDKMADQISDAVLDAVLKDDATGRVACETLVTTGLCVVAGEITTKSILDVPRIAREVIADIGFTDAAMGYDAKTC